MASLQEPLTGVDYPVVLGDTFKGSLDGGYQTFQYSFKPEASVDRSKNGRLIKSTAPGNKIKVSIEFPNYENKKTPYSVGTGSYTESKSVDCILIFDGTQFRLERLTGTSVGIKMTQASEPASLRSSTNDAATNTEYQALVIENKKPQIDPLYAQIEKSKMADRQERLNSTSRYAKQKKTTPTAQTFRATSIPNPIAKKKAQPKVDKVDKADQMSDSSFDESESEDEDDDNDLAQLLSQTSEFSSQSSMDIDSNININNNNNSGNNTATNIMNNNNNNNNNNEHNFNAIATNNANILSGVVTADTKMKEKGKSDSESESSESDESGSSGSESGESGSESESDESGSSGSESESDSDDK